MADILRMSVKRNPDQYEKWLQFLNDASIRHEDNVDFVYGVYEDERLIATGSIYQNILKCIAVCKDYSGGAVFNQLISFLMSEVFAAGFTNVYVYTKKESVLAFQYLGFKEIARVKDDLVFLEKAIHGFDEYLAKIKEYRIETGLSAAIVMNANPFTRGHQYLVDYASKHADRVFVFVLSEDISAFPAGVRLDLVKKGTAHLKNVTVLETGSYMVSSQTFPSYFLKEDLDITFIHASLDATIFKRIAHEMNIRKRFVGEEPYSLATAIYNQALKETLAPELEVEIIPRLTSNEEVISASRVRKALLDKDYELVKELVPNTTYTYLESEEGRLLVDKIRKGGKSSGKI